MRKAVRTHGNEPTGIVHHCRDCANAHEWHHPAVDGHMTLARCHYKIGCVLSIDKCCDHFKLNADRGEVPSKICVGTDYEWCSETQDIDWKYYLSGVKLFEQYVQGNYANDVWYRALYEARQ